MDEGQNQPGDLEGLSGKMARGVAWMAVLKISISSLSIISTLILVRLLEPEDFGVVAMAMFFLAILEMLSWFSFDVALIQNQSASREEYDTAWTLNLMFRAASALTLVLIAKPVAFFYGEPRVELIIYVLSVGVLVGGFSNIGIVDFRKNLDFKKDVIFMFTRKLSMFIVTIPLAFVLRNYWALVIGSLSGRFLSVAVSFIMSPYRPTFCLSARGRLLNFSKWLFANNLIHSVQIRLAEPVVGRIAGPGALGLFNISYEISNTPTTELVAPINRAVFPGYAKMASDLTVLRQGYLNVIAMIALVAMPAGAGVSATAELLVPVALGEKWLETIPLISVLAWFGVISAMQTNIGSVYYALGRPRIMTALFVLQLTVLAAAVIPATMTGGVERAVYAYVVAAAIVMPVNFAVALRTIKLPFRRLAAVFWRPLTSMAVMFVAVRALIAELIRSEVGAAPALALSILSGVAVYAAMIWTLWTAAGRPDGAEHYIVRKVLPAVRGRLGLQR